MNIQLQYTRDIAVLKIEGRMDTSNYREVETFFSDLIQGGEKRIICDLSLLEYISSSGLRAFLAAQKELKGQEGSLVLVGMTEAVKQVFTITGFISFFETFESVNSAL